MLRRAECRKRGARPGWAGSGAAAGAFGMVGRCSRLDHHTVLAMVHLVDDYTV
jgi:hypothetical protein